MKPTNKWLGWLIERESYKNLSTADKTFFLNNYTLSNYKEKSFVKLAFEVADGKCLLTDKPMILGGSGNDACSIDHVEAYKADNPTLKDPNTLINLVPTRVDSNSAKGDKTEEQVNDHFNIDYMDRVRKFNKAINKAVLESLYRDFVNQRVADLPKILVDVELIKSKKTTWKSDELKSRYPKTSNLKKYFEDMLGYPIKANTSAMILFNEKRERILELMRGGSTIEEVVSSKDMGVRLPWREEFYSLCNSDDEIAPLITTKTETAKMIDFLEENESNIRTMLLEGQTTVHIAKELRLMRDMTLLKMFINKMSIKDEYENVIQELKEKIDGANLDNKELMKALQLINTTFDGDVSKLKMSNYSYDEKTVSVTLAVQE
jgi:hypothetical protein